MTRARALVTGGAGFIGRYVCRELDRRGYEVVGVGHGRWSDADRAKWGVSQWHEGDLSPELLTDIAADGLPCVIVHCAGTGSVSCSYEAPLEDFNRSVVSTAVVLDFVRTRCRDATRVVVVSSGAVYGDQGDVDLSELAQRAPVSPYGHSKVAAENLCEVYSHYFGIRSSIVRLFSVYGEGLRKQLLWDAMQKFENAAPRFFGTGQELRDWIHVEDAASLLCLAALSSQTTFEVYNGGHEKASTKDVLTGVVQLAGLEIELHFTGETHTGNPNRLTADCSRARNKLGWKPAVSLATGLERYVHWFRSLRKA